MEVRDLFHFNQVAIVITGKYVSEITGTEMKKEFKLDTVR